MKIIAHKMKFNERKMQHEDNILRFKEVISDLSSDTSIMRHVQYQHCTKTM